MARLRGGLCLSLFALVVSNVPCFAQRSDAPTNICQGLANIPTQICLGDEYKKANQDLKSFLAQIRDVLTRPEDRERLNQAQAAWEKGRDLTCDAESRVYFGSGSGQGTEAATCLDVETRMRLQDLHAIYDWRIEWTHNQRE